ncbi:MAG: AAA family ATPase [Paracoccus sp. (in: a-proteobacteria)]|uniref:AAA family ATPase n=1 Tax=Paracoccus sp. TaxID=267 RepID=UPI003241C653
MNAQSVIKAEGSDLLAAALAYAARGWKIFPCAPGGKAPITENGYKDGTTDPDRIKAWWAATPNANIGVNLVASGLLAVDADTYKPDCRWSDVTAQHGVPATLTQRSARGGTHFIFAAEASARYQSPAAGVDLKHRGLILLEPSTFEGGTYRFQNDAPIAPAPAWLKRPERTVAEVMGNAQGVSGCTLAEAEDALKYISADCGYLDWLPILQGLHNEFGDDAIPLAEEWSATALHRYQEGLVETKFASFTAGEGVTISTVFDRARKAGADLGQLRHKHFDVSQFFTPVDPESLPVVPANLPGSPSETVFHILAKADEAGDAGDIFPLMRIADLMHRKPPLFLVDRHIPQRGLGFVYGQPGAKKSFMVQDMALSIAHGFHDWHGDAIRPTGDGSVIYIAAEGSFDLPTRIEAWRQARGLNKISDKFFALEAAVNFMQPPEVDKLIRSVRAYSAIPTLVVVDTVSRAMPGADENMQKEMSLFVQACERIQHAFDCSVLGVHHAGKSGAMRGSTVLQGAGDFVIKIEWDKGKAQGKLTMEKQKAAEDGWSYAFQAEKHVIFNPDPDEPVSSSLVFERAGEEDEQQPQPQDCRPPSPTELLVLDAVRKLPETAVDVAQVANVLNGGTKKRMEEGTVRQHLRSLTTKKWLVKTERGLWSLADAPLGEAISPARETVSASPVRHKNRNSTRRAAPKSSAPFRAASGKALENDIFV